MKVIIAKFIEVFGVAFKLPFESFVYYSFRVSPIKQVFSEEFSYFWIIILFVDESSVPRLKCFSIFLIKTMGAPFLFQIQQKWIGVEGLLYGFYIGFTLDPKIEAYNS